MKTRTGGFSIGFRRGGSAWQADLGELIAWSREHGLEAIDLRLGLEDEIKAVREGGLRIGSLDIAVSKPMLSPDRGKRAEAIAQNADYVRACGARNYFLVMLPERPDLPRAENFGYMVESYGELVPVLEDAGAHLVIELPSGEASDAVGDDSR